MPKFLATLHSELSNCCAVALIDSKKGVCCLQQETLSSLTLSQQLRGISVHNENIYITTPSTIRLYQASTDLNAPALILDNEIQLPEWILGGKLQTDLVDIFVSQTRKRIFVGNNLFNSLDELTLGGVFVKRHSLYDIAPNVFCLPDEIESGFRYGHIRYITEMPSGSLLVTIASVNSTTEGIVIDFDTGNVVLSKMNTPHGGICADNRFYIQNVRDGKLLAYPTVRGKVSTVPEWIAEPIITNTELKNSIQCLRGMAYLEGEIFCGVCHFGKPEKGQIAPRIISFDAQTGRQTKTEIFFQDLENFREPRVFSLSHLPAGMGLFNPPQPILFFYGKQCDGELFNPLKDANDGELLNEQSNEESACVKNITAHTDIVVDLKSVNLSYQRSGFSFFSSKKHLRHAKSFHVLRDVSFSIYEGETIGIVGRNGAGKSTISMLMAGALPPDNGSVTINGRIQLLSIGLGFRNELTGRENAFINGTLLGMSTAQLTERMDEIVDFAELDDFIDEPVRTYSSGMRSRLGFGVATAVSPDILILDEVMSTGDASFRAKANKRMEKMRERTKTIIIISHSASHVRKTCSRVIWLNKGQVQMDGEPKVILAEYAQFCKSPQEWMDKIIEK